MRLTPAARPARAPTDRLVRPVPHRAPRRAGALLRVRAEPPEDARSAIDAGIALLDGGDAQGALDMFTRALSLPGRGIKRFR
jgi:hypothetical protein